MDAWEELTERIVTCRKCPRLVAFREEVKVQGPAWRKPVPGFGDPRAWLLIVGLAPSAQGGNRTGRVFTGDPSGRFLMKALHAEGFASQARCESADDGLELLGCYLTAAVKCVPPQNLPTKEEFRACRPYLDEEWKNLKEVRTILALGRAAFELFGGKNFAHGARLEGAVPVYASFHPSPQNTYTGKLTHEMLCALLRRIRSEKT